MNPHKLFTDYLQLDVQHLTRFGIGHTLTNARLEEEVYFFHAKQ
jgi:hypothetical protein